MSSDPSLRRGPSAGESLTVEEVEELLRRQSAESAERKRAQRQVDIEAASPPAGDSRLTEEKDSLSPGNTGQEEPQAVRLQPPPDNATVAKDLSDWLRESVRSGYLFGCYDEPLDDAGKRIVRAIVARLEAV